MSHDISREAVLQAVNCINAGGVLLYPTDTVYGIGGDAGNDLTSQRIRDLKGTESDKPLLVLTDDWDRAEEWMLRPAAPIKRLMAVGRSYPLTILFPASPKVPRGLIGASSEIGIRLCRHPFCVHVIREAGTLISSTSANRTGDPVPLDFERIDPHILNGSDYAVDGGRLAGIPSTIVRVKGNTYEIVREGSLPADRLASLLA